MNKHTWRLTCVVLSCVYIYRDSQQGHMDMSSSYLTVQVQQRRLQPPDQAINAAIQGQESQQRSKKNKTKHSLNLMQVFETESWLVIL